jgi:hypothetical protein
VCYVVMRFLLGCFDLRKMVDRLSFCILISSLFIIRLILSLHPMKFAIDWFYLLQNVVRVLQV